jgi:glycosyltransferase involved in cell wall biosynthesis
VDSFSEDRTVEVARGYTDRIIQHEFAGHVAQTRYASEQTMHPWVLWLDADERLTPEALDEVRKVFERPGEPPYKGFAFPRKTFFMDRWIMHSGWYPQQKVRLFHREAGAIGGEEPHPHVALEGPVRNLKGDILHYTYPEGLRDLVATSSRYADHAARARHAAGRGFSLLNLLLIPPATFLKKYVLQLGVLDGLPGLAISAGAAYYRFMREVMIWELEHAAAPPSSSPPAV